MITKYVVGDICDTELRYIAHGVNCQNAMGSGVAKSLFSKWRKVKDQYHTFNNTHGKGNKKLLGAVNSVHVETDKWVINMFTQFDYGYDGKKLVNYAAIVNCFSLLMDLEGPIAIPKIGCGLAGGDWKFVEQLINDTVGDDLEIWVYELTTPISSRKNDLG